MGRTSKKHRPPQPGYPQREPPRAAPALDRRDLASGPQIRRPYAALAVCGLLLLAVGLAFGQSLRYEFVNFDDDVLVYDNPVVSHGLTAHGVAWAFTTSGANMWYPLTWISYMVDRQVFGPKPWGYHLTNLLLHAATAVILFLALRRMTGNLWASALVALLFAVHPLRAEAVAWVGEQKSPLSGLFFVSTIAAYVAYARRPFSLARYSTVAGLFALGLLAKPTLVTLPFLLLLLDYWPLGRWRGAGGAPALWVGEQGAGSREDAPATCGYTSAPPFFPSPRLASAHGPPSISFRRLLFEKVPLLLLSAGCSVAAVVSQGKNIASLDSLPIPARIANALVSYAVYLGQLFWPVDLAGFYPRSQNISAWQVACACLVLTGVSAAALMWWRKQPALLVGWLWYLGTLLPTIGLVQIGKHGRADRYTYLPHIGLAIAVVWGVRSLISHLASFISHPSSPVPDPSSLIPHRSSLIPHPLSLVLATTAALLLGSLMACAWQQTSYWQNSEMLWTRALACSMRIPIAHNNLGIVLAGRGQVDEAIAHYHKALEIDPDNLMAHNNLGIALAGRGEVEAAIAQFHKVLEIDPDNLKAHNNLGIALAGRGQIQEAFAEYQRAMQIQPGDMEAYNNFGSALAKRGQIDKAIALYLKALEIKPDYAEAHKNLGIALAGRGRLDEAVDHYRQALEIKPHYAEAHNSLGIALASRGLLDEAIGHYRQALELKPDYAEAHNSLGSALASRGQVDEAEAHFRKAVEIEPGYAPAHGNLGDVMASRGMLDEAIVQYRKAVEIEPDYAPARIKLGDALARRGQLGEALAHYQKALDLASARGDRAMAAGIRARIRRINPQEAR